MVRPRIRWWRVVGALLSLALLTAVGLVAQAAFFRPLFIDVAFDKLFAVEMLQEPELLTRFGMAEVVGYREHNARLDDLSEEAALARFARWKQYRVDLDSYGTAGRSESQLLNIRISRHLIDSQLESEAFRHHEYLVNQLFGVQRTTPEFMMEEHPIPDERGAIDYVKRLRAFEPKFTQVIEQLTLREAKGILPPRFVLEHVVKELEAFVAHPTREHPLFTSFVTRLAELQGLSAERRAALEQDCARAVEEAVVPVYRRLLATVEAQRARATDDDGVWKLPDGEAYYAYRLRAITTSTMTPDQVHALGVSEVARLEQEMSALLQRLGEARPDETPGQAMARLGQAPEQHYPDTEAGKEQVLADYRRLLEDQAERSRALFARLPDARLEVERVHPMLEKTAPFAFYSPPGVFGPREGTFYVNLRSVPALIRYTMRTVAIHEGIPGHHTQTAMAQSRSGGPFFRRVLPFVGYAEGWAMYAESLGPELGVYRDDPLSDLGRMQAELLRAARLVVDSGIHVKRWTRREAIDYLQAHTGMPEAEVVPEIERYIVEPAQACAYKVGMARFQEARRRATQALGPRFDLKTFHTFVLELGAVPLAILDDEVDRWVARQQSP